MLTREQFEDALILEIKEDIKKILEDLENEVYGDFPAAKGGEVLAPANLGFVSDVSRRLDELLLQEPIEAWSEVRNKLPPYLEWIEKLPTLKR